MAKEVKLIALQKGIRSHQHHDRLVRDRSHQTCLQHTQTLLAIFQELGWLVNIKKSDFIGYQFDLREGKLQGQTHHRALADLKCKNQETSL